MLNQEMLNKLKHMKMTGLVEALEQQEQDPGYEELGFHERLNLLVDWEYSKRQHNRLQLLINQAKFQNPDACVEDINYAIDRKLDRNQILELASCNYVPHGQNVVIVGATGAGKSYIAQALGQAACRRLIPTKYIQLPDLLEELKIAKNKGPEIFTRLRKQYVKCGLLIIDEWLLFPISTEDTEILLSIFDRRRGVRPTIVVSQLEPAEWLDQIPIQLAAESITDRLSTKAHRITIKGNKSMRSI
ncbi:ATP-binding protein [Youngiibacter fragilis]|uniref:ATPase AAA n=1 Tax=Youngiibacter fragilis 232.1 TaxID=994573 RepID=V7I8A7_9CLOT|nr:ATP-binding protein [Youngiibacter fragilis]ETA81516.1 ATPase AAA [Youngiibacter fragilis 232.1]